MPWVQVHFPKPYERGVYDEVKAEIAKVLGEELDKPEQGLSVSFYATNAFYRAGEASDKTAALEVKYIGNFSLEKKKAVTERLAAFLSEKLRYDPMKIIVLFTEVESCNWGRRGGDFS